MRRKRRRQGDNNLDLTSLLDVIFILLMLIMAKMFTMNQSANSQLDETVNNYQAAADAKALWSTQNEINGSIVAVSIVVPYEEDNVRTRYIKMLVKDVESEPYVLQGKDVEEAFAAFQADLTAEVEKANEANMPVIIALNKDDEKILYRDEVRVKAILDELASTYNNVYRKGYLDEE